MAGAGKKKNKGQYEPIGEFLRINKKAVCEGLLLLTALNTGKSTTKVAHAMQMDIYHFYVFFLL